MKKLPPFPSQFSTFHKLIKKLNVIPTDANNYVDMQQENETVRCICYAWVPIKGWFPNACETHTFMRRSEATQCFKQLERWLEAAKKQRSDYLDSIGG
jgi:hypothetical protein